MLKGHIARAVLLVITYLTAACSTQYTPNAGQTQPVDIFTHSQKVDTFVVLLDTSGSMKEELEQEQRRKIHNAQDLVASFGAAVPPLDFQAGLVTFGKGSNSCVGYGVATTLYEVKPYDAAEFTEALGSIRCAGSTTPIADALDSTTGLLEENTGNIAIIIFSDFKWKEMEPVNEALSELRSQQGDRLCVHTVQLGNRAASDKVINELNGASSCGSSTHAADIASASAMTAYAANTLMKPAESSAVTYEKFTFSAMTLFDFDKAILKPEGEAELRQLGDMIRSKGLSVADIDVVGHTDSVGDDDYNKRLSMRRAMAVKYFINKAGVDASIIDVSGMGETEPVASNDTEEGRALNRRVEVHVGTTQ